MTRTDETSVDRQQQLAAEARAVGSFVGQALTDLTDAVHASHSDISAGLDRVLPAWLQPLRVAASSSAPSRALHRFGIIASRSVPAAAIETAMRFTGAHPLAPSQTERGRTFLAIVNGLWSGALESAPLLEIHPAFRSDGNDVAMDRESVAAAYPDATGDIAIFIHGMAMDERCWTRPETDTQATTGTYGDRLRDEAGVTAAYVRYSTGVAVTANALALANLVDELIKLWPVPVTRVSLVGHSMGGLVAVGAAEDAERLGLGWRELLGSIVTLGSPHHGADLARLFRAVVTRLYAVPVIGPINEWLRLQSDGGADLCADPHLAGEEASPTLSVTVISASRTGTRGRWLGDGLVPVRSAAAGGVTRFVVNALHIDGADHFALLNHPVVYAELLRLLRPVADTPRVT